MPKKKMVTIESDGDFTVKDGFRRLSMDFDYNQEILSCTVSLEDFLYGIRIEEAKGDIWWSITEEEETDETTS